MIQGTGILDPNWALPQTQNVLYKLDLKYALLVFKSLTSTYHSQSITYQQRTVAEKVTIYVAPLTIHRTISRNT